MIVGPLIFPIPLPTLIRVPSRPIRQRKGLPTSFVSLVTTILSGPPFLHLVLTSGEKALGASHALAIVLVTNCFRLLVRIVHLRGLFRPVSFRPLRRQFRVPMLIRSNGTRGNDTKRVVNCNPFWNSFNRVSAFYNGVASRVCQASKKGSLIVVSAKRPSVFFHIDRVVCPSLGALSRPIREGCKGRSS